MWNVCPIDSREACLSVPRARSLHCHSSFTIELFILVCRASQLTRRGALCGESLLSVYAPWCACIYMSVLVHVSVSGKGVWMCVPWRVRCLCAWMRDSSEKERMGYEHRLDWGNGCKVNGRQSNGLFRDKTERRDSSADGRFIAGHVRSISSLLFPCLAKGTDQRWEKSHFLLILIPWILRLLILDPQLLWMGSCVFRCWRVWRGCWC